MSPSKHGELASGGSRDLDWKRTATTSLASLTRYVVIAQDAQR